MKVLDTETAIVAVMANVAAADHTVTPRTREEIFWVSDHIKMSSQRLRYGRKLQAAIARYTEMKERRAKRNKGKRA
jgi:hypothetical protein